MNESIKITGIESQVFWFEMKDIGMDSSTFNYVYTPGSSHKAMATALRIFTDVGVTGEYVHEDALELSSLPAFTRYLIGRDPLERELIYSDLKRAMRQYSRLGLAPVDNALWDLAGKYYKTPIYRLLGGYKKKLPCYASTYHGDTNGGLDSPEAYADFAAQCRDMGYPAFKIHGWTCTTADREIETISAVRKRVGDKMDLMIDPACELISFADALKVGWSCDENHFLWYEDPYRDGGISQFGHKKLRQLIRTPLLMTEHVRSLEPHMDFAVAGATDFVRGDARADGLTATLKLAHAVEALGLDIELHAPGPVHRQLMAALRNTNYYEMALVHPKVKCTHLPPVYSNNYRDGLDAIDKDGCVTVPDGPGLGVGYDWEYIEKHRISINNYK